MADRILLPQALDANGDPVSAATAYFFEAGTTTEATVYADSAATTPHGTSLTANAAGVFVAAFTTQQLKVDVRDSSGASLPGYPSDEWYVVPASGGTAASIAFKPVDAGTGYEANGATDVQQAITNNTQNFANYQPKKSILTAIGALTGTVNKLIMMTGSTTASLLDFKDEDDMASDSATAVPSQQSVKAYVDTEAVSTWATAITPTGSETTLDFTSIPSGVRKIEIVFNVLSTNGTSDIIVQIGDSGGIEATGYNSGVELNGTQTTDTTGFIVTRATVAADTFTGVIILRRIDANIWVASGSLNNGGWSGGSKSTSATLDRVRITTVAGIDAFDNGRVTINYTMN